MANKPAKNAERGLIEQSEVQKHVQPAKGWAINQQKRTEMLKECLLSNQENKNMYKQLMDGQ